MSHTLDAAAAAVGSGKEAVRQLPLVLGTVGTLCCFPTSDLSVSSQASSSLTPPSDPPFTNPNSFLPTQPSLVTR